MDLPTIPQKSIESKSCLWYNKSIMSEYHDAFLDGAEEDPRTQLADVFRGFFLRAIEEQALRDTEIQAQGISSKQPGTLYKTDGGWLKMNLEVPADDVVFHSKAHSKHGDAQKYPSVWVLLPLPPGAENADLRDVVMAADDILVHARVPGHEEVDIWVNDSSIRYSITESESLSAGEHGIEGVADGGDTEQQALARHWVGLLLKYDLRTIAATNNTAA